MFRNTYQNGFLSILYSIGSKPLQIWGKEVHNGHIKRVTDADIQSSVLEVAGNNVSTTYISCPSEGGKTLGIKLPFLVMVIKNLKRYFTFEVTVLDDKGIHRRFRASNYQSTTRVKPFICTMPMRLDEGWNQIQFNLADFTRRAYGTNYVETLRIQIHANCRIRRIYFADRLYAEEELPAEFKLFLPVQQKHAGGGGGASASGAGSHLSTHRSGGGGAALPASSAGGAATEDHADEDDVIREGDGGGEEVAPELLAADDGDFVADLGGPESSGMAIRVAEGGAAGAAGDGDAAAALGAT